MSLMPNLRSPDSELRDTLTYRILVELLVARALNAKEMSVLLGLAASPEYLFYRIGEVDTDSVFARSFGALIVPAVVEVDARDAQLSTEQMARVVEATTEYARVEQDHRGFVDGKGWAHSVAHIADALDSLAQHPHVTRSQQETILDAVSHVASLDSPLIHGEDDRIAYVALRLARRDRDCRIDWQHWLAGFQVTSSASAADDIRAGNMGHFLRALYLMLHWEMPTWEYMDAVLSQIRQIHGFYRYGTLPLK